MVNLRKLPFHLHIPLANLADLSAGDLLAIEGPKFITSDSYVGARTFAVLISHDLWKRLNHGLSLKPVKKSRKKKRI